MNREEALNLVRDRRFFQDLTAINVVRYSESDIFGSYRKFFPEGLPHEEKLFITRLRYQPKDFLVLRGEHQSFVLLSPETLKNLCFQTGAAIMGFYIRELMTSDDLFRYRSLMGDSLFNYVYYFACYAPYAEDLGIRGRLSVVRPEEAETAMLMSGCYALIRVLDADSDPEMQELLEKKLSFATRDSVFEFFRVKPPLKEVKTARVQALMKRLLSRMAPSPGAASGI